MPARPLLPFADPKAGYLAHKDDIDAAVRRVLEGGWYILGPEVTAFEKEFAAAMDVTQAIGVGGESCGQDFDRHVAPESCVAGFVDLSHATSTKRRENFVRTEPRARGNCHEGRIIVPSPTIAL